MAGVTATSHGTGFLLPVGEGWPLGKRDPHATRGGPLGKAPTPPTNMAMTIGTVKNIRVFIDEMIDLGKNHKQDCYVTYLCS